MAETVSSYGTIEGTRELTLPYTVEVTPSGSASSFASATISEVHTFQQYAPMIDIRWQASDLKSLTLPTSTASPKPGASVSGASATSSPSSNSSSGLSTGAIVAIAVVIPVVVIAVAIAAFFLLKKRRKSREAAAEWPTPGPTSGPRSGPTVAAHQGEPQERHEVKGTPVYELANTRDVHEMASQKQLLYERPEMNGNSPGET